MSTVCQKDGDQEFQMVVIHHNARKLYYLVLRRLKTQTLCAGSEIYS